MTATITFDVPLLYFVALNVIGILIYVLMIKSRTRRINRNLALLTKTIADHFHAMGCEIALRCVSLNHDQHFVAFIDSEPMKRFRVSHKLEAAVMEHVRKTTDLHLDAVYWRFIVKHHDEPDAYLRDGLALYELEESTLEEFHEVRAGQVTH